MTTSLDFTAKLNNITANAAVIEKARRITDLRFDATSNLYILSSYIKMPVLGRLFSWIRFAFTKKDDIAKKNDQLAAYKAQTIQAYNQDLQIPVADLFQKPAAALSQDITAIKAYHVGVAVLASAKPLFSQAAAPQVTDHIKKAIQTKLENAAKTDMTEEAMEKFLLVSSRAMKAYEVTTLEQYFEGSSPETIKALNTVYDTLLNDQKECAIKRAEIETKLKSFSLLTNTGTAPKTALLSLVEKAGQYLANPSGFPQADKDQIVAAVQLLKSDNSLWEVIDEAYTERFNKMEQKAQEANPQAEASVQVDTPMPQGSPKSKKTNINLRTALGQPTHLNFGSAYSGNLGGIRVNGLKPAVKAKRRLNLGTTGSHQPENAKEKETQGQKTPSRGWFSFLGSKSKEESVALAPPTTQPESPSKIVSGILNFNEM